VPVTGNVKYLGLLVWVVFHLILQE
jgi:hypothetical protein